MNLICRKWVRPTSFGQFCPFEVGRTHFRSFSVNLIAEDGVGRTHFRPIHPHLGSNAGVIFRMIRGDYIPRTGVPRTDVLRIACTWVVVCRGVIWGDVVSYAGVQMGRRIAHVRTEGYIDDDGGEDKDAGLVCGGVGDIWEIIAI